MLLDYIHSALKQAKYELLEENEGFYASVPVLPGVWASAPTLERCREELLSVIEDWICVKLRHGDRDFPVLDGVDLNKPSIHEQEVA